MTPRRTAAAIVLGLAALWTGACEGQQSSAPAPGTPATPAAPLSPPLAPTSLTATAAGETAIALAWAAPASATARHPVTGYRVEWSADGADGWTPVEPAHTGVRTLYRHEGLSAGTTRHYRVFALSAGGESPASDSASASTEVPAAATVVFAERNLTVREGRDRSVSVFYRVADLETPLPVTVSAIGGSAADYELSGALLEIPAGNDLEGYLAAEISIIADDSFAEGDEEMTLRLTAEAREGARVVLGDDLPVLIEDAPVMPCAGVALSSAPPEPDAAPERLRATLTSEWRSAADSVSMEWLGPYQEWRRWVPHHPYDEHWDNTLPHPGNHAFHIESWRMEPGATLTRHVREVSWPAFATLEWAYRCDTGEVVAACNAEGCSLRR